MAVMSFLQQTLQKQPGSLQTSTNMFEGSIIVNCHHEEVQANG
jgi:hypothetical protein